MSTKLDILQSSFIDRLNGMVQRSRNARAYLSRVAYAQYQEAQIARWNSENASEGDRWKALNPLYKASKTKRYAKYPYAGSKMLVATGTLLKSVVGTERKYHRKIVGDKSLEIRVTLPYAPFVHKVRPFMEFGEKTTDRILDGLRKYLIGG